MPISELYNVRETADQGMAASEWCQDHEIEKWENLAMATNKKYKLQGYKRASWCSLVYTSTPKSM